MDEKDNKNKTKIVSINIPMVTRCHCRLVSGLVASPISPFIHTDENEREKWNEKGIFRNEIYDDKLMI